jgi:hypothetical protein
MDNDKQPPHNNHGGSLRLPLFWAENSEAWFGIAESRFRLRNIENEQVKFDLVVNALPKECLRTVLDLVTNPPEEDAFEAIKERLSEHHNLTEFQHVEKIHAMEVLGGRKPSELLHEMLELCPTGHEASSFFLFLFLQCLPSFLRIMLREDDYEDIRAVAVKADKLWAIHTHQQHGTVAVVEPAHRPKGGFQHLLSGAVPGCPPHSSWGVHRRSQAAAGVCGLLAGGAASPSTRPCSYAQVTATPPSSLLKAKFVYIRCGGTVPSLQPLYAGLYQVLSGGDKCFTVEIGGKAEVVSIDRLKPHLGQALIAPAPPLARRRPPKPPTSSSAVPPGGRH